MRVLLREATQTNPLSPITIGLATAAAAVIMAFSAPSVGAAADTCTWTGAGDGSTLADGSNWSGCDNGGVPETVDILEFATIAPGPSYIDLTNDLGYAVSGINITNSSGITSYSVDTLSLVDGAVIDDQGAVNYNDQTSVTIDDAAALGDLTIDTQGAYSGMYISAWSSLVGTLTLSGKALVAIDDTVTPAAIIVENGAYLDYGTTSSSASTGSYPITLGGGAGSSSPVVTFGGSSSSERTWTFGNPITLLNDATILVGPNATVTQSGSIDGAGFALSMDSGSAEGGTLILNPSANNSDTNPGTYYGSATSGIGAADDSSSDDDSSTAPGSPDTGISVVTKNAIIVALLGIVSSIGLVAFVKRAMQK